MLPDGFAGDVIVGIALEIVHENKIGDGETPEPTFRDRSVGIHLVDAPVVRPAAPFETFGGGVVRGILPASIDACRIGSVRLHHRIFVRAQVHVML